MEHAKKTLESYKSLLREWGQIVLKCWLDPSFLKHVIENPKEVISKKAQIPGVETYKVHENTHHVIHLVLLKDLSKEITQNDLKGLHTSAYLHGGMFWNDKIHDDYIWSKITEKAWKDEEFKNRLLKEPESVLAEYGFQASEKVRYRVHCDTDKVLHLSIPVKPDIVLSEEDLKIVSGGSGYYYSKVCSCLAASASP